MTQEQLSKIRKVLASAQSFCYEEMDVICDEDYAEDIQVLCNQIEEAIQLIDSELQ
ncbi:MAG: hypothetical protein MJZ67_08685 [Bacteroidales bacterium]|nr:hypothetical protein [Bacteroidales bacterium]